MAEPALRDAAPVDQRFCIKVSQAVTILNEVVKGIMLCRLRKWISLRIGRKSGQASSHLHSDHHFAGLDGLGREDFGLFGGNVDATSRIAFTATDRVDLIFRGGPGGGQPVGEIALVGHRSLSKKNGVLGCMIPGPRSMSARHVYLQGPSPPS